MAQQTMGERASEAAGDTASATGASAVAATFAPLRHRVFLAIWLASIFSSIGSQLQQVGASWLMTSLDPSPAMVALVTSVSTLPILLFSLPAGALADILDRRMVLFGAQVLMLAASAVLAVAAFAGVVTPGSLLALTFLVGAGQAIMAPAWQSSVGDLVPRADVPQAVALNVMGFNIARTVGPAIGGVLVAMVGSQLNFALNAVSYLAMIGVLVMWRPQRSAGGKAADSVLAAMRDGMVYTMHSVPVRRVILRAMCFGFCSSIVVALMALVARDLLGQGPAIFGMLMGFMGAGAVVGATSLGIMRRSFSTESMLRLAVVVTSAALVAIGLSRMVPLTCLALFSVGWGMVLGLSTFNVAVQMSVPRWVSGRALALYQMFTFGGMAAGAWFWGHVAEWHGIGLTYPICAAVLFSTLLLGLRMPVHDVALEAIASAPHDDAVDVAEAPSGSSLVIVIEYCIAEERQAEFLQTVMQRQRLRLRDGARQMILLQDVVRPEFWSERFQVRSREEFLRQRERRTVEAKELDDMLAALHAGDDAPDTRIFVARGTRAEGQGMVAPYPMA